MAKWHLPSIGLGFLTQAVQEGPPESLAIESQHLSSQEKGYYIRVSSQCPFDRLKKMNKKKTVLCLLCIKYLNVVLSPNTIHSCIDGFIFLTWNLKEM